MRLLNGLFGKQKVKTFQCDYCGRILQATESLDTSIGKGHGASAWLAQQADNLAFGFRCANCRKSACGDIRSCSDLIETLKLLGFAVKQDPRLDLDLLP